MVLIKASPEFKFTDGSVVTFDIEAISKEDRKLILNQCRAQRSSFEKKEEDFLDKFDFEKFNRLVILRVVKGWSGLKNKHLLIIYDVKDKGDSWRFKGEKGEPISEGAKRETEIHFTPEALRELAEMHSPNFMDWINFALNQIDLANIKAKEAELKN